MTQALSVDVTGVAVIAPSSMTYSGCPIYGRPGLFVFDFKTKENRCIVPPSNFNPAYTDGTDYFAIDRVDLKDKEIFFWHVPDVDKANFEGDWKTGNEYKINFDGTGLTKVEDK